MFGSILTRNGGPSGAIQPSKKSVLGVTLVTFQIQTHANPPFPTPVIASEAKQSSVGTN
jgi:hypothetical protein